MREAWHWLDGPRAVEGMFVEFMEEMKGVKQVPMSLVNEGEGPGVGGNDREV